MSGYAQEMAERAEEEFAWARQREKECQAILDERDALLIALRQVFSLADEGTRIHRFVGVALDIVEDEAEQSP